MEQVYSVSKVNSYIKNVFTRDYALNNIYIKGEVSNCKYHSSGHIYFTLKDQTSQIACVMFAGNRSGLNFKMTEGQSVIALGSVSVYERDGKYQLYAREVILDGTGYLYEQFERLKRHLSEEGLFEETHKKPIPMYARTVGVVTASTGAAIQDIINITTRRNPYVQLILYPALVQGEGAKQSIVKGIKELDQMGLDVLIVGRGGGSIEDLWGFNEEEVARVIYNCNTPIISAVGHETDTTIADYVSDLRAPTPSAAAELAVCNITELMNRLDDLNIVMNQRMMRKINDYRNVLERYRLQFDYISPLNQVSQKRQYLIDLEDKLQTMIRQKVQDKRHQLELYMEKMNGLSPIAKLNIGYAYVTNENGSPVRSVDDVRDGETVTVQLLDGEFQGKVESKNHRRR